MRSQFVTAYSTYGAYRHGDCSTELLLIRVIRGRLQKLQGSLAGVTPADKVAFLWLNTELRGCLAMESGTT